MNTTALDSEAPEKSISLQPLASLIWFDFPQTYRTCSTVMKVTEIHYFTYWCRLSCQRVAFSLGDNETAETIFLLPLAAMLHGVAL